MPLQPVAIFLQSLLLVIIVGLFILHLLYTRILYLKNGIIHDIHHTIATNMKRFNVRLSHS